MPQDITKEIMEEFDKKFPNAEELFGFYQGHDSAYTHNPEDGTCTNCPVPYYYSDDIKDFILSALSKQRAEFRRVVESKRKELFTPKEWPDGKKGVLDSETAKIAIGNFLESQDNPSKMQYNSALDDLLLEIKN
jgi:hypothetical protein